MIRRISKNNDYMDIIESCPSGVIDDIYKVDYFIAGHPETVIEKTPEKVGRHLEIVISANEMQTLTNGILMRRAFYSSEDSSYPDGHYDLEFVDSLDMWLGEEETEPPFDPGYLTSASMKTLNGESLVGVGNIDVVSYIPSYYVTESWISSQNFATQTWVENKSYASITYVQNIISSIESEITTDLSSYATKSWVSGQEYMNMEEMSNYLSAYAYTTENWVEQYLISQSYMTEDDVRWILAGEGEDNPVMREEDLSNYATQYWVQEQGYITSAGLSGLATQSWVLDQGYITSETLPEDIATQSWVEGYISECGFAGIADVDALSRWVVSQNYATQSWVSSNFLSTTALTGYATESWVQSQGYLTSHQDLSSYATQSWVESQGYLSEVPSSYATQSWVTSNFFEESKIWTGTFDQWLQLTSAQQALYTIALIIE